MQNEMFILYFGKADRPPRQMARARVAIERPTGIYDRWKPAFDNVEGVRNELRTNGERRTS